jgi:5-methyltetrahydrofolate--homocysteine methyltransferase
MTMIDKLCETIEAGRLHEVEGQVRDLLEKGIKPAEIIDAGIIATLDRVGRKFSDGEIFVPEMLIAAKCSQKALDIIKPILKSESYKPKGKVVIGTVKGDLHDIGKNIVALVFETAGLEVNDLGVDVSPQAFVDTVDSQKPDAVALSCLLTTTLPAMSATVEAIKKSYKETIVIVGGPPVTEQLAKRIGADLYGKDAYAGVELLRSALKA